MIAIVLAVLLQFQFSPPLPPAGLHASVPWQVDDYTPGRETEIVDTLDLDSYYNYQELQRSDSHAHIHVPLYFNLTDYDLPFVRCKFVFLWNEPDREDQSDATPREAAETTLAWSKEQERQCGYRSYAIHGGLLSVPEGTRNWIEEYLEWGGPLPDVWHLHIYAHTADEFLNFWGVVKTVLEEKPHLAYRNGQEIPVILSEVGGVGTIEEAKKIMSLLWFLIETDPILHSAYWFTGADWGRYDEEYILVGENGEFTELGQHFKMLQGKNIERVYLPVMGDG